MKLGRIGLFLLLAAEISAACFCGWQLRVLHGWQGADASVLRTSPDAAYLYHSVFGNVAMARGFLLGLLTAAAGIAAVSFWGSESKRPPLERVFLALTVAVPLIALLAFRV
jgi:hypothetical protein